MREVQEGAETMMSDYEPDSGFNLPPGCYEDDVDRAFGGIDARCATCVHARRVREGSRYERNCEIEGGRVLVDWWCGCWEEA